MFLGCSQKVKFFCRRLELLVARFGDFPTDSVVKNPPANAEDAGLISGSESSPGDGNDNTLRDSCLGNPIYRGAWWATLHRVAKI